MSYPKPYTHALNPHPSKKITHGKRLQLHNKARYQFDHLELMMFKKWQMNAKDKWFNQTLTKVNDSVVRVGIVEGEYHWHKHDNEDEFFFVFAGQAFVDLEDKTFELNPNQGVTISRGIVHRTERPKKQ